PGRREDTGEAGGSEVGVTAHLPRPQLGDVAVGIGEGGGAAGLVAGGGMLLRVVAARPQPRDRRLVVPLRHRPRVLPLGAPPAATGVATWGSQNDIPVSADSTPEASRLGHRPTTSRPSASV